MAISLPLANAVLKTNLVAGGFQVTGLGGLTLTAGHVTLFQAPASDLHASSKKYVDDQITAVAAASAVSGGPGIDVTGGLASLDSIYGTMRIGPSPIGTHIFTTTSTWEQYHPFTGGNNFVAGPLSGMTFNLTGAKVGQLVAPTAGKYLVRFEGQVAFASLTETVTFGISVNGADPTMPFLVQAIVVNRLMQVAFTDIVTVGAGHTITAAVQRNEVATVLVNTQCILTAVMLGP